MLILGDFIPVKKLCYGKEVRKIFSEADNVVFNLEGAPYNKNGESTEFDIQEVIGQIHILFNGNVYVCVNNNHILDNGIEWFNKLLLALEDNGIEYFGTKEKPDCEIEGQYIYSFQTYDTLVGKNDVINVISPLDYQELIEILKEYDIAYPHWGYNKSFIKNKLFKRISKIRSLKIFGHHNHLVTCDGDENRIFSLGNCYINHKVIEECPEGLIVDTKYQTEYRTVTEDKFLKIVKKKRDVEINVLFNATLYLLSLLQNDHLTISFLRFISRYR